MQSDELLMMQYSKGDMHAFELLYAKHKGPLYRYLYRQTSDPTVADDLFQEIWINLIKARERYKDKAKFSTYLFRIAHNRLIDYYRSKQRGNLVSYIDDDGMELIPAVHSDQPENRAEVMEGLESLNTLLNKLPEAQREVFLLKEESGLSLEEIAEVTGSNSEAVKSRLRYALKKLRSGLKTMSHVDEESS